MYIWIIVHVDSVIVRTAYHVHMNHFFFHFLMSGIFVILTSSFPKSIRVFCNFSLWPPTIILTIVISFFFIFLAYYTLKPVEISYKTRFQALTDSISTKKNINLASFFLLLSQREVDELRSTAWRRKLSDSLWRSPSPLFSLYGYTIAYMVTKIRKKMKYRMSPLNYI